MSGRIASCENPLIALVGELRLDGTWSIVAPPGRPRPQFVINDLVKGRTE